MRAADGGLTASVVIPTRNRERYLAACLDCLSAQDCPSERYEIIVVDDASTDDTESIVRSRHPACRLTYLRQPRNAGSGAAKNVGIAAAQGDIVIFTDSDALAPPWYVGQHIATHERHPRAVVDGPAISMRDDRLLSAPPFGAIGIKLMASMDFLGEAFVNANASCRRDDLERAGGFDEAFLRWQDLELYQRLRAMGLKRVRNRRAHVLHFEVGRTSLADTAERMRAGGRYAAMFYDRHPSPWARRKTRLRYLAYDDMLRRLGLTGYLAPSVLERTSSSWVPWHILLRRACIVHSYAKGLREGFVRENRGVAVG